MRSFLIDPFTQTITEVEHDGHYTDIYRLIQAEPFTTVALDADNYEGDVIYVDDEGLYRDNQRYFLLVDYWQPLAGRGLVLGTDAAGESIPPKITLEELQAKVQWAPEGLTCIGFEPIPEGTYQDTPFGRFPVIGHRPVFSVMTRGEEGGEGK